MQNTPGVPTMRITKGQARCQEDFRCDGEICDARSRRPPSECAVGTSYKREGMCTGVHAKVSAFDALTLVESASATLGTAT